MTTEIFLNDLPKALSQLPSYEVEEILRDQREYITDATSAGRNEEEVIHSLGSLQYLRWNLSRNISKTQLKELEIRSTSIWKDNSSFFNDLHIGATDGKLTASIGDGKGQVRSHLKCISGDLKIEKH